MKQNGKSVSALGNEKRNLWSRQQLTKALLALLKKKELNDITVSELCEKAGVGRVTFYRNYPDMTDIVRQFLIEDNREWTESILTEDIPFNEKFRRIFHHFEEERDIYEVLNRRHLTGLLQDVLTSSWQLKLDGTPVEAYTGAYLMYLVYGFIEVWFRRGMIDSSEDMAELLSSAGKR